MKPYPKSRLPGPSVRMFDYEMELLESLLNPQAPSVHDETVRGSYDAQTIERRPDDALLEECREETKLSR